MNNEIRNRKVLFRKAVSLLMVICMMAGLILPLIPVTAFAAAPSSYTTITADSTASVTISSSGTSKYFRFVPAQSGTYRFYSSANYGDTYGSLLDASGNTLTSNDDSGGSGNFSITYDCTKGTTYYIRAYMYGSNTGSYTLNVVTLYTFCDHDYVLQSSTPADCENNGTSTYKCSLCEYIETRTISALGHSYVGDVCSRCGYTLPPYTPRSEYNSSTGDVFLGGRYIELGISKHGSFGTSTSPRTAGFHRSGSLGMIVDGDGWDYGNPPTTGDFFLPGTPEERYVFSYYYNGVAYNYAVAERYGAFTGSWKTVPTVSNQSSGNTLKAVVYGVTQHNIGLELTYSFGVNDKNYKTSVRIINEGGIEISNVRFVRIFDPDQDREVGGDFGTYNKVLANPDRTKEASDTNYAMVVARGSRTLDGFFFVAFDTRAYASQGVVNFPATAYVDGLWSDTHSFPNFATEESMAISSSNTNGYTFQDTCMAITFNVGSVAAGSEDSLEYYSSMSPNVESDLEQIIRPIEPTIDNIYGAVIDHDSVGVGPYVEATVAPGHTISYQWYLNDRASNEGGVAVSGATDASYCVPYKYPAGVVEYYYCVITATRTDNGLSAITVSSPVRVDYLGNTHDFEEVSRIDATCTADGQINYVCRCGEEYTVIIFAHGHSIETVVEAEATCTKDGLIIDRCVNVGCDYEKRTVVHGSHNYSITDRKDAACETPGYVEYTCSGCKDKKYEYFDGKHNYVESSREEAGVELEGSIVYTCTECGDSYSIVIPALSPVLKNSSVLLIQDSLPWAEDVNTALLEVLKNRGVVSSYNIITTSALSDFDLSQYGVVFIANDQSSAMYNRLAANTAKLEAYVRAGGNLIYGACDQGWGGGGSISHSLPGGVTTSNYYSVYNYIVNGMHPIVTGVNTDNRSLKDELLKGNYCSHTYFNRSSLPEGTDVILRDANGNPTLIEYNLGDGTVIASGLTWEYFYVREHYGMVTNYSKYAYDDLVTYMVYMSNTCEHNYEVVETVEVTCEENGYTKYVCSICSREYMGNIVIAEGHKHVETSRTNAGCTANGEVVYTCKCGNSKTEIIIATGHSWTLSASVDPTCTEYGQITYSCDDCSDAYVQLVEPCGHDYAMTATVDPTCVSDGYIDFACQASGCEATKHQTIDMLGHSYGYDNVCDRCGHTIIVHTHIYAAVTVEPTCSSMGYTEYTCECGHSYRDSYMEPTRHNWNEGEVTITASCTSDGVMTYSCRDCTAKKTTVIEAAHQWLDGETVSKTCTTDGSVTRKCGACGKVETEIIPAGHDWNEGVVITAPTCKTEGKKLCGCLTCGETDTLVIEELGHTYVDGVCTRCGAKFIDEITESNHPIYGMYFEIDDILSDYGPSLIDEYGLMLDYNSDAKLDRVAVYLTQEGTMWRRCIAVKGSNIEYATYVPYLSYKSEIKYTGLNHDWINIFRLSENSDGIWCYSNYATIGVNLQDAYGNLLLSLYHIGEAGAETRIFDDLDKMIAWLNGECEEHTPGDWVVDEPASCVEGKRHIECTTCGKVLDFEILPAVADHVSGEWIIDIAPTETVTGLKHKECITCHKSLEEELVPVLAKIVIEKVEAEAGSTVRVTVDIQNNPGIIGALLTLDYDPALKLVDVKAGSAWAGLSFTKPATFSAPSNFIWDGVDSAAHGSGTILVLTFEVPNTAAFNAVYNISISYTPENLIGESMEPVDAVVESGSITVIDSTGDVNDDGVVDVADVIVLRRYLVGGYGVTVDMTAADMDADGEITVADVVLLRRFLVG